MFAVACRPQLRLRRPRRLRARLPALFFLLVCCLSCATKPAPVSVDFAALAGTAVPDGTAVPGGAAFPGGAGFAWRPLYGADGLPVEGLGLLAARIASPRLEFWAIRVDLANPRLEIVVGPETGVEAGQASQTGQAVQTGQASQAGQAGSNAQVSSIKVSSFVREYGCIAAINANPFDPSSAVEGEARNVVGLAVSRGTLISAPDPRYDALIFFAAENADGSLTADGSLSADGGLSAESGFRAAVTGQAAGDRPVLYAAGGFYRVLENGAPAPQALSGRGKARHPRSAAGVSPDGRLLYLLVIDGRRPGSVGASEEEAALVLKALGAWEGLCFDGGGSSALAVKAAALGAQAAPRGGASGGARSGARARTLNKPVHGGIPGTERAVAVCLGIAVREP